jgi:hypothetical protein
MSRLAAIPLGMLVLFGFSAVPTFAQPANDKFSNATVITGSWGTNISSNIGATAEPGEPSHAGIVPAHSIWFKWVAPETGEVTLDSIGSNSNGIPLDTVLAVYTGPDIAHLNQVAANDDLYPPDAGIGRITGMGQVDAFSYTLPFAGPSALRFNASAGTTYFRAPSALMRPQGRPTSSPWIQRERRAHSR